MKGMSLRNRVAVPYHWARGVVSAVRYGFPARGMTVIGVTGTNGKTTTCFMIWKMLNESGRRCGLLSTVAWGVDALESQEHMTTMPSGELNRRIAEMARAGAKYLVLEVTSHALVQHRALGVPIDIAMMTNVTREHLDYHGNFANYLRAKVRLFRGARLGVVNRDDANYRQFVGVAGREVSYGVKKGEVRARGVELSARGVEYRVGEMQVRTRIPGVFNVYNSLAAVCVGRELGLSDKQIAEGIYALESVAGRMERVDAGQEYEVIVDFAHTPDAMEKVYESVGKVRGRIITVFGGMGRRDVENRRMRGELAARRGDILIVTEDNSLDEPVEQIMGHIVEGARRGGIGDKNLWQIADRREAVAKALGMARRGDVVLLLGMGHERTMLRGGRAVDYYEPGVAMEELKRVLKSKTQTS